MSRPGSRAPLVKGGQGRSNHDVRHDALSAAAWLGAALFGLACWAAMVLIARSCAG